MRLIRFFSICLAALAAALVLAVVLAFSPPIQNWLGNRLLDGLPGVQASAESASVGWSSVEYTNLQVQRGGVVLTAPDVTVELPAQLALRGHKLVIHRLVAKGWTVGPVAPAKVAAGAGDQGARAAAGAGNHALPQAAPDKAAAGGGRSPADLQQLLRAIELGDATIDGVDVEGDVIVPTGASGDTATVHVVAKGGGLAPDRAGTFAIDAASRSGVLPLSLVAAQGQLSLGVAAGHLNRLEFAGDIVAQSGAQPVTMGVRAALADQGAGSGPAYELDLRQGTTPIVQLAANFDGPGRRFAGTWKVNLDDAAAARWIPSGGMQLGGVHGAGHFDADPDFASVHVAGTLTSEATDVHALAPALARVPRLGATAEFELTRQRGTVTFQALSLALGGKQPVAVVKARQPFAFELATHATTPTQPERDWLGVELMAVPLAWLPELPAELTLSGGEVRGAFTVSNVNGALTVRGDGPATAANVALSRAGKPILRAIEVAATMRATYTSDAGWSVEATPLELTAAGRPVATVSLRSALRSDEYQRIAVTGHWTAQLDPLRAQPGFGAWLRGRTAGGDFSAHLGPAADLTTRVQVVGADSTHTAEANVALAMDDYRSGHFQVPLKVKLGSNAAAIDVEGTWSWAETPQRIDVQISSTTVSADQLRFVFGGIPSAIARAALPATVALPFWSTVAGAVRFQFRTVQVGATEFTNVAGAFEIDRSAIQLKGGRASFMPQPAVQGRRQPDDEFTLEPRTAFTADGALAFRAGDPQPYRLEVNASADEVDAKRVFGAAATGRDALIEGHWAVADKITATAGTIADLIARRHDAFHLTSKGGALRLLKTNVASALPDAPTPVSDSFAKVGSAVGAIFGHRGTIGAENKLSPAMEAVLNFTYQTAEIPYQTCDLLVTRESNGDLRIDHFEVTAPDEHLTGSGKIAFVATNPLSARPLTLDVQLAVKGVAAERLGTAHLLSKTKDALGYTEINQLIHFGGSLDSVDRSHWQSALARAAVAPSSK